MKSPTKNRLIKVTAWVPEKEMRRLMKLSTGKNQSGLLRNLIEEELERIVSLKAHEPLYDIAAKNDFDDRLL